MIRSYQKKMLYLLPLLVGSALLAFLPLSNTESAMRKDFQSSSPVLGTPPFGSIQLSTDEIYRNHTLELNVTAGAFGWPIELLNWTVDIANNTGNLSLQGIAGTKFYSPQLNNTWFVDPAQISAGSYWVVLWVKNDTETWIYKNFTVLNNLPVINSISAEKYVANRGESFNVTINATDVEITNLAPNSGTDPNIYVHVYYRDTLGTTYTADAQNIGNGNYSVLISTIGLTSPTGVYTFWAGVQDYRVSMEPVKEIISNNLLVSIRNNNPTIDLASNLIVNDQNPATADISVRMGNTINVTITASDQENTIRFIIINLKHFETGNWKNYSLNYLDFPHTIIIDSNDLKEGTWAFYITVIDQDGGSVEPPQHPTIEIMVELWTIAGPIIAFIIGIPVGLAIGTAFLSWRTRQNAMKKATESPADAEEAPPSVEKVYKAPFQPERKEEGDEEDSSAAEEPDSESKTQMKRKIRRRLN